MPWVFYAQARRYDAWNGRFVSKDSDKFIKITRPESFNQYLYCDNNPEKYIDPSGNMYYIFYIDQFDGEVDAEATNINDIFKSQVKTVRVSDTDDSGTNSFASKWNENITEDANIEGIIIYTHGEGDGLYGKPGRQLLSTDTIHQLNNTADIGSIVIIACDTAHDADKESWNLASAFSTRFEETVVVASNGNVWHEGDLYISRSGDTISGSNYTGEPLGWYGYYYKSDIIHYKYGKNYPDDFTKTPYTLDTLYLFADEVKAEKE